MSALYTKSRACPWVEPRQRMHASERYYRHGPIQPMDYDEPGLLRRIFRRQA